MPPVRPIIAVTGASGFIGSNLAVRLQELGLVPYLISRDTPADEARLALGKSNIVFHLAGANRPEDPFDFIRSNEIYAWKVANIIAEGNQRPLVICSSTVMAGKETAYGRTKLAGEVAMQSLADEGKATVAIFRLPNVFGKWARPNYNSAVATFCHNVARGLPLRIDNADAPISLLYIDDLIDQWIGLVGDPPTASGYVEPQNVHHSNVGSVAETIISFAGREAGRVVEVGTGLARALYATFVSALPVDSFAYPLGVHDDPRGRFSEILKTPDCGQVSFFTVHPGRTRGGHYHHSKVEKFVVVHGEALFKFRQIRSDIAHEIRTSADHPLVVESIPGWSHEVTNVGKETMVALVWANEVFDPDRPDTVAVPL